MADLAVWQRTIVDEEGNVIPGAEIEVRREEDDSLATLYADRAGESPLANPLAADMSGFVRFFAQGDAYTITAVGAGSTRTWRFDPTGRLQEFDRVSEALVADDAADLLAARSNLGTFSTVAEVQSRHIPPVLESILTNGYYDPGDGGGALYKRAASEPSHAGKIQSADGAWWEILIENSLASALQFGAVANGIDDDAGVIQDALNTVSALGGGTVFLPIKPKGYAVTTVRLPPNTTLRGEGAYFPLHTSHDWDWSTETCKTPWIKAIGPVNTPLIEMSENTGVTDIRLMDLRQNFVLSDLNDDFVDTQVAIQLGHADNYRNHCQGIERVAFFGFKKFVVQYKYPDGTVDPVEKLRMMYCYGAPFETALDISRTSAVCWVSNCHFAYNTLRGIVDDLPGDQTATRRKISLSVTTFRLGRCDGFIFTNTAVFGHRCYLTLYRNAYTGDNNLGGGIKLIGCDADVVHRGVEVFRDGGNALGFQWIGGQINPVVYVPGHENTAFYFNRTGELGDRRFIVTVLGTSIQTGSANPSNLDIQDYDILGPQSAKSFRYGFELEDSHNTVVNMYGGCVHSHYVTLVDPAVANRNGNSVNLVNVNTRQNSAFANRHTFGGGATNDQSAFKLVSQEDTETNLRFQMEDSDGNELLSLEKTGTRATIRSASPIVLRPNHTESEGVFVGDNLFRPQSDDTLQLGGSGNRWSEVFSATGVINTSDEREKTPVRLLSEAEEGVAKRLSRLPGIYQWLSAIDEKGADGARLHMGVTAQDVKAAFDAEGLDGFRYGVLCWDEWDAEEAEFDEEGNVLAPAREAGDRYGVRYDELAQWQAAGWNARLAALEGIDD